MGQQAKTLVTGVESAPHSGEAPQSQRQLAASTSQLSVVPSSIESWTNRYGRPFEVAGLVALSAVLHVGAAYGFYTSEKAPPERRLTSVDIEFVRPPEPPKPEPPPPPPPAEPKVVQKQAVKPVVAAAPDPEPPAPEPPVDTGVEAEAAEDGNLLAGKGGTGIQPVTPPVPPTPPAPAVVAPPAPIVQAHEGANYSKNPRPAYPARAKREGWQGKVVLRVQVLPNGRAGQISIQASAGRQQLDDAAQAAVRGWTFVPARRGGTPVAGWVNVPIEFRLQ